MVSSTPLLRRLIAGAFGLIVGAAGTIALSTPAAAVIPEPQVDVEVQSTCDELLIVVTRVDDSQDDVELKIEAGPAIATSTLGPNESQEERFFPRVSYEVFIDDNRVAEGEWEDTDDCGEATVIVESELHCDSIALSVTAPRTYEVVHITREDDDHFNVAPEPGTTVTPTITDVTEDTVVVVTYRDEVIETIQWQEPADCPSPGDDDVDDGTGGEGGTDDELPVTGSSTLLIAGIAVALLVVGGGLYLATRRRRQTFSA